MNVIFIPWKNNSPTWNYATSFIPDSFIFFDMVSSINIPLEIIDNSKPLFDAYLAILSQQSHNSCSPPTNPFKAQL